HRGLPPIHFEKLTCTACHSGPMPKDAAARIQTALAHGLGIASEDRSAADAPTIYEPVFMLASEEQVTVGRLMWPSLFARLVDDTLVPIATDQLHAAMTKAEVKPTGTGLDNEQIVAILGELAAEGFANGEAVFVRDGLMWRSGQAPAPHELAKPYTWALAHDVRPAEQALGAGGCTDCHSLGAPLFFGHVGEAAAVGEPLQVLELYGGEEDEARIWGFVFIFRPLFKWYGWACVLLITIVLGSAAIAAVAPRNNHDVPPEPALDDPLKPLEKLVHVAAMLATAALAITGIGGWLIEGRVSEWMLLIHMSCSGLFLISLVAVAFVWSHRCWPGSPDYSAPRRFVFWLALLLGLVSAVSMLSAMLPVVGYGGQAVILVVHRYTGIAFVLLMVIHTILSRRVKTPAEVS
ncbi:MAG: hypothetical protein JXO22_00580, partial [Phycisphaerae bacterium]|nr:hypothetical protein [Phycisphaerae bacterium]